MFRHKIFFTKDALLIIYKLLHDVLFLLLFSFLGIIVAEGALPGLITSHIGLAKIAIAIVLVLGIIVLIGSRFQIIYEKPGLRKNKLLPAFILFSFILIGNSLLKFALWENMIITVVTILVFLLLYQLIFSEKK